MVDTIRDHVPVTTGITGRTDMDVHTCPVTLLSIPTIPRITGNIAGIQIIDIPGAVVVTIGCSNDTDMVAPAGSDWRENEEPYGRHGVQPCWPDS